MSSVVTPNPAAGPAPLRPPMPPPGGFGSGGPAIDPIKLLKKWKFVLGIAAGVGLVLGVVGNFVWAFTYPFYDSTVTYEAKPPPETSLLDPKDVDEKALERFMLTQAERMLSTTILERVTQDPRLQREAPKWSAKYQMPDGAFDYQTAMKDLKDQAKASPIKGTTYLRLKVTWKDQNDVASLARLLSDAYMNLRRQETGSENNARRDAIQRSIADLRQEITNQSERRARLIRDQEVTGIVEQATTTREKLSLIARERNNIALEMRVIEVNLNRMNEMLRSEAGVRYTDTQHAAADAQPVMERLRAQRELLEMRMRELRRSGFLPDHREVRIIETQISAIEQQMSVTRERELARLFDAEKDMLETMLQQSLAKEADLVGRERELELTLQDLTRTIRDINDITNQIGQLNSALADRRKALEDIQTTSNIESADRVVIVENARIPDRRSHPQLPLMIILGVFLVTGLTSGVILAAEFLDQRVKGAADLAAMPRTKVLGTIPLADEDPSAKGSFETVIRDSDRSMVAESIRQIRTALLKQMDESGHRTCVIVGGMPGSGSTSVVTNLGLACAGVERRVLLVDANFRRPSLHRVLGVKEGPGLADVLAGEGDLERTIQAVNDRLHVLSVGSSEHRLFERLGTQPMGDLLNKARTMYDIVLIDTPPAVVSGDAKAIAQYSETSVLIARALSEKRGMVARFKNELGDAKAQMLGVIVNAVRSAAGGYLKRNIRTSAAYHAGATGSAGDGSQKGSAGKAAPERTGDAA